MIDVIIPTMWMAAELESALVSYLKNPKIKNVILIDNNRQSRPKWDFLNHDKLKIICHGNNMFVNPAWNEGYKKSTANIIGVINDDIVVQDSVFEMVINHNLQKDDIIGVNLRGYKDNYKIDDLIDTKEEIVKLDYDKTQPIGGQAWAFGICMFMLRTSYKIIPSLYQIWYGDEYLTQNAKNVYVIKSDKIKGRISETLKRFDDPTSAIQQRIKLDSKNLINYSTFGEKWDIPQRVIKQLDIEESNRAKPFFQTEYLKAKSTISDINENVHVLYDLAKECKTVVEMGVRTGVSTRAFLNTDVELISFDIVLDKEVENLFTRAKLMGKNVRYEKADVLNIEIDRMDLLFIDTLHTYTQLSQELEFHGNKANKYIAFHDTYTFGLKGEDRIDNKGLLSAIIEFMIKNPHWKFKLHRTNNNGITVLERTQ